MADLICDMPDCIHRSKRPLRKWRGKDGSKSYGCMRKYITISNIYDADGEIEAVAGIENMAQCAFYEPAQEEGEQNV